MINPFIKLTGFLDKQEIFISVDEILIYNKHLQENYTEVEIDRLTIDVIETPEEISAMIQKYYDHLMLSEYAKHSVQRDSMDAIVRADLAFDLAESMVKEFKERTSNV